MHLSPATDAVALAAVALALASRSSSKVAAVALHSTSTFVPAKSLQAAGRVAYNDTTALFEFPGVEFSLTLSCALANASVSLDFDIEVPKLFPSPIAVAEKFSLSINSERSTTFVVSDSSRSYSWADPVKGDAARPERTYTLRKITERMAIPLEFVDPVLSEGQAATALHGVRVTSTGCKVAASPRPSARRLDFLGDSITCGFGNLVSSALDQVKCITPAGWRSYEDFDLSQGHLAATRFGARLNTAWWVRSFCCTTVYSYSAVLRVLIYLPRSNHIAHSISILGVMRNGDSITRTSKYNATHYLHRAVPSLGQYKWDYAANVPDVAVVNLGTNDYDISRFIFEAPSLADFGGNYTVSVSKRVPPIVRGEEHSDGCARLLLSSSLALRCDAMRCDAMRCDTMRRDAMRCNAM